MPGSAVTSLTVTEREPGGSRAARRLRREGLVLGVVYGGGEDPVSFSVDARELRQALAHGGAVLDLSVGSAQATPVVLKDLARHPVNGRTLHVDLLRVRLDETIQATVVIDLVGADEAPGTREGGVLEQITREVTIEALPTNIPDSIRHDVSGMQIGDTLTLGQITGVAEVQLQDDPETVIATLTPPRLQTEAEEGIEQETEIVGEGAAEDASAGDSAGDESSE